jgi:hypothetical protein
MTVNLEIKGKLAKLLATENLLVEHRNVETASFDIENRILTLPTWEKASKAVFDMLVGHEVGHALFTPPDHWEKRFPQVPFDFVNVVEDARIERLMKRRYAGLNRFMYAGYKELYESDFFSVKDKDLNEYALIDRINLYFKAGTFVDVPFNDEENEFVTRAAQTESFEDVLQLCVDIAEYLSKKEKKEDITPPSTQNKQSGDVSEGEQSESEEKGEEPSDEKKENNTPQPDSESGGDDEDKKEEAPQRNERISETQRSFDNNKESLTDHNMREFGHIRFPTLEYSDVVVEPDEIHQVLAEGLLERNDGYLDVYEHEYKRFKKDAAPEVNYLVKEFEMKKSADAYARASVSRTGVLDCSKLHTYKYNEDLFKKVTTISEGKNHGLIFVLDWSGSMEDILLDSYKQILSLLWFCKKVNIPFEVYCFTNSAEYFASEGDRDNYQFKEEKHVIAVNKENFKMVNILSSSMKSAKLDACMLNIWFQIRMMERRSTYNCHFALSGTPLVEAACSMNVIIPNFLQKTKVQKIQCVFFTDGEGAAMSIVKRVQRPWEDKPRYRAHQAYQDRYILTNPKNGMTYNLWNCDHNQKVMQAVNDNFPNVNFINFRVISPGDFTNFYYRYNHGHYFTANDARDVLKKKGFIQFDDVGFTHLYGVQSSKLNVDTTLEVSEDATHAQLRSSFRKMFKNKKANKKLLSTFMSQIA